MADYRISKLEKLLLSALDKRPDEFGLYPEKDGWFRIKDVFFALKGEEGAGILTPDSISFNVNHFLREKFEIDGNRIRVKPEFRTGELVEEFCVYPPSVLYSCIKEKNIEHVSTKGLTPNSDGHPWILTDDRERAQRFFDRTGSKMVLIEVDAEGAFSEGVEFNRFGSLYLVKSLPSRFIVFPELTQKKANQHDKSHNQKKVQKQPELNRQEIKTTYQKPEYGSFFPTLEHIPFIRAEDGFRKKDKKGKDNEPSWKAIRRERKRR